MTSIGIGILSHRPDPVFAVLLPIGNKERVLLDILEYIAL
jgi:hypothetical protein